MSDSDIVKDFLIESYENLDRLDRDLVGLEKNPEDKEALAGVFRTIHTIKGTCGFLGFNKLEALAHVGEPADPPARPEAHVDPGDHYGLAEHGGRVS
jgi:chemotaxis protein histidine kinase CheA